MWFNIIKEDSLDKVTNELKERVMPLLINNLIKNGILPNEQNIKSEFIRWVQEDILSDIKTWQDALKEPMAV
jgi:hypothetical protein